MEFLKVVGDRRSVRWFRPWEPVEPASVQRILETARWCGCPGNLQPWRAVVVVQRDLDPSDCERLLDAANRQRQHEQAPVWIYWFADITAVAPGAFYAQIEQGLKVGMLAQSAGWDASAARSAIEDGVPAPQGMPPLHQTVHGLPQEFAVALAMQETNAAITLATLAAVDEGLGTCLLIASAPSAAPTLYEVLGLPETFVPVWLQLVGHSAESREAGGQRPREPFDALYSMGRWGTPMPRDEGVVEDLRREGLIQAPAPLPGRDEELRHLGRMFGYAEGADMAVPKLESAWNARSGAAVAGMFTPDGVRVEYALPGARLDGREAIAAHTEAYVCAVPDCRLEVRSAAEHDGVAVVEWTFRGTHSGDLPGLPAQGEGISLDGVSVCAMEGDLIREERVYWDAATLLAGAGVLTG